MRVVHFCDSFSPLSETFIYDYITELERQGIDNHVVTLRRKNEETRPFPKVHVLARPWRWHPQRIWRRTYGRWIQGMAIEASFWPMYREQLEQILDKIKPDVIHAHFGPQGALAMPCSEEYDIPLVVSFHGFDAFQLPKLIFWRDEYSILFNSAARITTVSNVMRGHLEELGAPTEKLKVIRVGKKMADYPYKAPSSPVRNWVSVGRFVEKKGFIDCVSAFKILVRRFPESRLSIIGDGPLTARISRRIESAGMDEHIQLLGSLPHREVKKHLQDADAFLLCSKEAANGDREGVPTVLMEAQASGLPVVTTHHSGIPEVIPENHHQYLAPEGNTNAIAESLIRLASCSVSELAQIAERGRRKIEGEFNLTREVEKLRALYSRVDT